VPGTHPLYIVAPHLSPTATVKSIWREVFQKRSGQVEGRPKSTIIAYNAAWTDLERLAAKNNVRTPGEGTPLLMTAFVDGVRSPERSVAVSTVNWGALEGEANLQDRLRQAAAGRESGN
jgi:hypothetical protein